MFFGLSVFSACMGAAFAQIPGDIDGDGNVGLMDNVMALQILAGIDVLYVAVDADVNGDGKIGMAEAIYILQMNLGVRRADFNKRSVNIPKAYRAFSQMAVSSAEGMAGEQVSVEVRVDDGYDILGAAFTVEYDDAVFQLASVDSNFFGTFASQGFDSSVDGYDQPLVFNEVSGKGALIAAARAEGSGNVLFTLNFIIAEGAAEGDYDINIAPTVLNNADAGYSPEGEETDILYGTGDPHDYPVLLSHTAASSVTKGTVTIVSPVIKGDVNRDGSIDINDVFSVINIIFGAEPTGWELSSADMDEDGKINVKDMLMLIDIIFGL